MKIEDKLNEFLDLNKLDYEGDFFEFIKIIRQNLFSIKKELKTTMFFLIGFMIIYELSIHSKNESFKIWIIEISDIDLITKITPLVISYIYYEVIVMFSFRKLLLKTHSHLLSKFRLNTENNFMNLLLPPSTFTMNLLYINRKKRYLYQSGGLLGIFITYAPVFFIIYCYYNNFITFKFNLTLIITFFVSLFFIINGIYFFFKTNKLLNKKTK